MPETARVGGGDIVAATQALLKQAHPALKGTATMMARLDQPHGGWWSLIFLPTKR